MKIMIICVVTFLPYLMLLGSGKKENAKKDIVNKEIVVPNYQKELDKVLVKFKKMKMPEKDREVMTDAADGLKTKYPKLGLRVGAKAPLFKLKDENDKEIILADELKKGPVILNFYRGGWCTFCNLELKVLEESLPLFKKHNAQVICITPQTQDKSKEQKLKNPFSFPVLSDPDYSIIKSYNLYNEIPKELISLYKDKFKLDVEGFNGKGRTDLPSPGIIVVNQKGLVIASFADTDYKKRMEPKAILDALEKIKK